MKSPFVRSSAAVLCRDAELFGAIAFFFFFHLKFETEIFTSVTSARACLLAHPPVNLSFSMQSVRAVDACVIKLEREYKLWPGKAIIFKYYFDSLTFSFGLFHAISFISIHIRMIFHFFLLSTSSSRRLY